MGVGVEMMVKFRFGTRVDPRCLNRTCLRFEADTGNCKSTLRPDNTLNRDCFTVANLYIRNGSVFLSFAVLKGPECLFLRVRVIICTHGALLQ